MIAHVLHSLCCTCNTQCQGAGLLCLAVCSPPRQSYVPGATCNSTATAWKTICLLCCDVQGGLTPAAVVERLDKVIIAQEDAKKAVAIAFRNRCDVLLTWLQQLQHASIGFCSKGKDAR